MEMYTMLACFLVGLLVATAVLLIWGVLYWLDEWCDAKHSRPDLIGVIFGTVSLLAVVAIIYMVGFWVLWWLS